MRQSSINTFSEGLNFDLNPITTPNNVLTDCINGTFLTFNGDELALQNDAGNTKIKVPNTVDEWVQLTAGYYPLGIKEYGGVLYIISTNGTNVEFGSYPSPENGAKRVFPGIDINYRNYDALGVRNDSTLNNYLYKYNVINNADFKTGRYVVFDNFITANTNETMLSGYNNDGIYVPKFYKIKLLHQLSNGYLDLTEDIWKKYISYKGSNLAGNHWYEDNTFNYYCPGQFKGKLATSIEIEELKTFKLDELPNLSVNNEFYTLTFKVDTLGIGIIDIKGVIPKLWINDVLYTSEPTITNVGGLYTISYSDIPIANQGKTAKFKITPILRNNTLVDPMLTSDPNYFSEDEFPLEYTSKFIIQGIRLLLSEFDGVTFSPVSAATLCDPTTGTKTYRKLIIEDANGNYLDNLLALSGTTPYVFIEESYTPDAGDEVIATYTVGEDGLPANVTQLIGLEDDTTKLIVETFKNFTIVLPEADCTFVDLFVQLNVSLIGTGTINVNQFGIGIIPFSQVGDLYGFKVKGNTDTRLVVLNPGYESISHDFVTSNAEQTLQVAMAGTPHLEVHGNINDPSGWYQMIWSAEEFVLPTGFSLDYDLTAENYVTHQDLSARLSLLYDGTGYSSSYTYLDYEINFNVTDLVLVSPGATVLEVYGPNVITPVGTPATAYRVINGTLFRIRP